MPQSVAVSMLIVLNGPPAAGKSTLARQYCVDHPLAFALDIDGIRHQLGRWRDQPAEAGLAARAIAVAAARVHLTAGYDVVVPQLLANQGFLDELAAAAAASSAQCTALPPHRTLKTSAGPMTGSLHSRPPATSPYRCPPAHQTRCTSPCSAFSKTKSDSRSVTGHWDLPDHGRRLGPSGGCSRGRRVVAGSGPSTRNSAR